jgi:hypothetical protein
MIVHVEICSFRYPIRFALIAHLNVPDFNAKKIGKKVGSKCVVLVPICRRYIAIVKKRVSSVNGLIMVYRYVVTTKGSILYIPEHSAV